MEEIEVHITGPEPERRAMLAFIRDIDPSKTVGVIHDPGSLRSEEVVRACHELKRPCAFFVADLTKTQFIRELPWEQLSVIPLEPGPIESLEWQAKEAFRKIGIFDYCLVSRDFLHSTADEFEKGLGDLIVEYAPTHIVTQDQPGFLTAAVINAVIEAEPELGEVPQIFAHFTWSQDEKYFRDRVYSMLEERTVKTHPYFANDFLTVVDEKYAKNERANPGADHDTLHKQYGLKGFRWAINHFANKPKARVLFITVR